MGGWYFNWKKALILGLLSFVLVFSWNVFEGKVHERLAGNLLGIVIVMLVVGPERKL